MDTSAEDDWFIPTASKLAWSTRTSMSPYRIEYPVIGALTTLFYMLPGAASKLTKDNINQQGIASGCLEDGILVASIDITYTETEETVDILFEFNIGGTVYTSIVEVRKADGSIVPPPETEDVRYSNPRNAFNGAYETLIITIEVNVISFRFSMAIKTDVPLVRLALLESTASGEANSKSNLGKPIPVFGERANACPRIRAFACTDIVYGGNLSMMVLRVMNGKEYIRYPNITGVAAPALHATLVSKSIILRYDLSILMEFSSARYFLWYLVTGKWCTSILRRRFSTSFLRKLASSKYSCWVAYFAQPKFRGYEDYFLW